MIQSVRIESEQITLPIEVIRKFVGKEIMFIEFQDGFFLRPVSDPIREARGFLKKSRFSTRRYFEMKQEDKSLER